MESLADDDSRKILVFAHHKEVLDVIEARVRVRMRVRASRVK